jgi:hypothetical protein
MRNGEILPSEYQIQKFMFSCLLFNDLARLQGRMLVEGWGSFGYPKICIFIE